MNNSLFAEPHHLLLIIPLNQLFCLQNAGQKCKICLWNKSNCHLGMISPLNIFNFNNVSKEDSVAAIFLLAFAPSPLVFVSPPLSITPACLSTTVAAACCMQEVCRESDAAGSKRQVTPHRFRPILIWARHRQTCTVVEGRGANDRVYSSDELRQWTACSD